MSFPVYGGLAVSSCVAFVLCCPVLLYKGRLRFGWCLGCLGLLASVGSAAVCCVVLCSYNYLAVCITILLRRGGGSVLSSFVFVCIRFHSEYLMTPTPFLLSFIYNKYASMKTAFFREAVTGLKGLY